MPLKGQFAWNACGNFPKSKQKNMILDPYSTNLGKSNIKIQNCPPIFKQILNAPEPLRQFEEGSRSSICEPFDGPRETGKPLNNHFSLKLSRRAMNTAR